MTRLPVLKPKQVLAALEKAGFVVIRVRASHYQVQNPTNGRRVTVPFTEVT
jgi:predicted RNA binding protein YcfA (HicA-like mRNA interferase family)